MSKSLWLPGSHEIALSMIMTSTMRECSQGTLTRTGAMLLGLPASKKYELNKSLFFISYLTPVI
jgi:hypothetical protein